MIPHDLHHFFVGQHVFVTGASGFIGGHVASLLIQAGAHVRAFRRSRKGDYDSAIDWVEGDLLARDSVDAAMKDCRYVFHVAGTIGFGRAIRVRFCQQCAGNYQSFGNSEVLWGRKSRLYEHDRNSRARNAGAAGK
jgi:hypothetical protein